MILGINKSDVEAGNIGVTLARLFQLTDSRDSVFRFRAAVILKFENYDREPRELFEIPQLRAYMQALTAQWPHWLWFLQRGSNSLPLLFSFLCKVQTVSGPGGNHVEFVDSTEFWRVLDDILERSSTLYCHYSISEPQAAISEESAVWDMLYGSV